MDWDGGGRRSGLKSESVIVIVGGSSELKEEAVIKPRVCALAGSAATSLAPGPTDASNPKPCVVLGIVWSRRTATPRLSIQIPHCHV